MSDISARRLRVRFAPSPTGYLHVGSARVALLNALWALQHQADFILRLDNTDAKRDQEDYAQSIPEDLAWMGLTWSTFFRQSDRTEAYAQVVDIMRQNGLLYPCYETPDELETARQEQLKQGKPPVYNRAALKLSDAERKNLHSERGEPAWRLRLKDITITWHDMFVGTVHYPLTTLSDPIVVRPDGSVVYLLASVIDDYEYGVTHVLRGGDHITNTAVQIHMADVLGYERPVFGHFPLLKAADGQKLSKRRQDLTVRSLREKGLHPMALNSFVAALGTAHAPLVVTNLKDLAQSVDWDHFGSSQSLVFDEALLWQHNMPVLRHVPAGEALETVHKHAGLEHLSVIWWNRLCHEGKTLEEMAHWVKALHASQPVMMDEAERALCAMAAQQLPVEDMTDETFKKWMTDVATRTGTKGRALYHPLRLALTGCETGPALALIVALLGQEESRQRLLTASSCFVVSG